MATAAIIVAAGQSRRMGFDKLLALLNDQPVLAQTILRFESCPCIDEIIIVAGPERAVLIREWIADRPETKVSHIVPGGEWRHQSVMNGLDQVAPGTTHVAVHDGARPLIHPDDVAQCHLLAQKHGAAACARRVTDTVKRVDGNHRVTGSVDRSNLWAMETPQIFAVDLLRHAYAKVRETQAVVTDEVSAVEMLGEPVFLSENQHPNLKVTFPQDLQWAARLI